MIINQRHVIVPNRSVLDTGTLSVAEMRKSAAYRTAYIGKWPTSNHLESSPMTHGFDYTPAGWERGNPQSYFRHHQNPALEDGLIAKHLTDRLTKEAIGRISGQEETEKPYFLCLFYYAVHAPFEAKDSLAAK